MFKTTDPQITNALKWLLMERYYLVQKLRDKIVQKRNLQTSLPWVFFSVICSHTLRASEKKLRTILVDSPGGRLEKKLRETFAYYFRFHCRS